MAPWRDGSGRLLRTEPAADRITVRAHGPERRPGWPPRTPATTSGGRHVPEQRPLLAVHAPVDYRDTTSGARGRACIDGLLWLMPSPIELGSASHRGRTCTNALAGTWIYAWCRPEWGDTRRASAVGVRGRMDGQVTAHRSRFAAHRAKSAPRSRPVVPHRPAAPGRGRARSRIRCASSPPVTDSCHDPEPWCRHGTEVDRDFRASGRAAPMVDADDVLRRAPRGTPRAWAALGRYLEQQQERFRRAAVPGGPAQ